MTAGAVTLASGETLTSDFTLTVTGARPQGWLQASGLDLTDGFIKIDACLQSSDPLIFAAGDCAEMTGSPRPKAGVFAVRAAPVLLHNLRARLTDSDAAALSTAAGLSEADLAGRQIGDGRQMGA